MKEAKEMSTWYGMTYPENKQEMYDLLASQLQGLVGLANGLVEGTKES